MRIDRNLNIVVPIQTEKGATVYVHSTPISRDIFEQFYLELGKVFSQCFDTMNSAHLALSAPQLAYPALKKIAMDEGQWEIVKAGLVNEILRLTNVFVSTDKGWHMLTLEVAKKHNHIDEDDEAEILSTLVFFTAISRVAPKDLKKSFLEMAGSLRKWELTSLDTTEYMSSLPTLTPTVNTGKKVKTSSLIC